MSSSSDRIGLVYSIIDDSAPGGRSEPAASHVHNKIVGTWGFTCDWKTPNGDVIDARGISFNEGHWDPIKCDITKCDGETVIISEAKDGITVVRRATDRNRICNRQLVLTVSGS